MLGPVSTNQRLGFKGIVLACLLFLMISAELHSAITNRAEGNEVVVNKLMAESVLERMPFYFMRNEGQFDESVKFYAKGAGESIYVTSVGIYLVLTRKDEASGDIKSEYVVLKPVGARKFDPEGEEKLSASVNYFKGNDPSKWRTDVATYGKVRLREVYPGVDMVFYGTQGRLQYDVELRPGADHKLVRIKVEGAKEISKTEDGGLKIELPRGGVIYQKKPFVYQEVEGRRVEIESGFELKKEGEDYLYGFKVSKYNRKAKLVIDPLVMSYSTFLGGGSKDEVYSMTVDSAGNVYVTGETASDDFPVTRFAFSSVYKGYGDVFVVKLNPNESGAASLIYSTFIGGRGWDQGGGIAVDFEGNIYVTGMTSSTDFPTTENAFDRILDGGFDVFMVKLDPSKTGTASLVYSTFLGGGNWEYGRAIAVDSAKNVYIVGETRSDNFPTTPSAFDRSYNGGWDVFVTKLNPSLSGTAGLVYSTFIGGSDHDYGRGIVLDSIGNVYLTGYTASSDFPVTGNAFSVKKNLNYDVFVTKLNLNTLGIAGLVYSTFLGGSGYEEGLGVAVDPAGNIYVVGKTRSLDFPTTANAFDVMHNGDYDVFVTKLDPNTSGTAGLIYSTFLGGSGYEEGRSVVIGPTGNIYVVGTTWSTDFPITKDAFFPTHRGEADVFITKLDTNISGAAGLIYSTFLGGSGYETYYCGIAIDLSGNIYVAGTTSSYDFPVTGNAFDRTYNNNYDCFIVKFKEGMYLNTPTRILQPNGGEKLNVGVIYTIIWEAPLISYSFTLKYSTDGKATWKSIATVPASKRCTSDGIKYTCTYVWTVPHQKESKSQCFIRLTAFDALNKTIGVDDSDRAFTIESAISIKN